MFEPTRNIEQIVATHALAAERRRQNLPVWDRTIDIKAIIEEDPENISEEHVRKCATSIASLIQSKVPASWFDCVSEDYDEELDELMFELKDEMALTPEGMENCADLFNQLLSSLYDWADAKRVWLG